MFSEQLASSDINPQTPFISLNAGKKKPLETKGFPIRSVLISTEN